MSYLFLRNERRWRLCSTFFPVPLIDTVEILFDKFSEAFSSTIIPFACSMQLLDLHSLHNVFNSSIIICKMKKETEKI